MAYFLTEKAEEDIINLFIKGAENFGLKQAEKYHFSLEQCFQMLSDFPKAAPLRTELKPNIRIYPFHRHIIIYTIQKSTDILILRVRHASEDWLHN